MKIASERLGAGFTHYRPTHDQRLPTLPKTSRYRFHDHDAEEATTEHPLSARHHASERESEDES